MIFLSSLFLLLSTAVSLRRDKSILFSRISIILIYYSVFICLQSLHLTCINKGIGIYGGLFQVTSNTQIFHCFIFLITSLILLLTAFYPRKVWSQEYSSFYNLIMSELVFVKTKIINKMGEQFKIIEYPLIILFVITGACFLLCSGDLVSIFLSIELQSYGLYLICTMYRNSELATSAGLTYFLLGGLSSCFILLSAGIIYAYSGMTHLDAIYIITNLSSINNVSITELYNFNLINSCFVLLAVGFLFKVSAAPFHFWSPDVYDAIPTIVTTFVAIIAKISIFIFLLELSHYSSIIYSNESSWTYTLLISSLLSLIIGTIGGLTQYRIKRLFAFSTISHLGFILLSLAINSIESIQSFIFYLTQYTISNLNAFIILIAIGFSLFSYSNNNKDYEDMVDKNNSPIQLIDQLKGYFYINPALALSLFITIFSLVGVPPLIGFFAKQMVLSSALDKGYIFMTFIAILTSVISAGYYLNLIKKIFFDQNDYSKITLYDNLKIKKENLIEEIPYNKYTIHLSSYLSFIISLLTLIILLFMFNSQEWLSIANILALTLFNI